MVNKAATTTALTSSKNPSFVGDSVTFTAAVTSGGSAVGSGDVTFRVDDVDQAPVPVDATGKATLVTSDLVAGPHTVRATYGGTATLATSSAEVSQTVDTIATQTALVSSVNPSVFGGSVTFTATVTAGGAPVTVGAVEFSDGATLLGAATLGPDGTAEFSTSDLSVGSHTIKAAYDGTPVYAASQDQVTQVVGQQVSATTVSAAPNPSSFGTSVTFTATVTVGAAPVTAGTVQFSEGGTDLGAAVPVAADGTATYSTATLAGGGHTVTATYSGTDDVAGSSGSVEQIVDPAASTTALTSAPNPSVFGQLVTLTATVTSAGGQVTTGTVAFSDGATVLCAAAEVQPDGTATCAIDDFGAGTHTLTATFSGSADFAVSTGQATQVVNQATSTTTLGSSANPSTLGTEVTFTATVLGSGGDPITDGTVAFSVDGTVVAAAQPLDGTGHATFPTDALTAGSHTIAASYSGTANVAGSDSADLTQVVRLVADAGGPYAIAEGQGVTLDGSKSSPGAAYEWDLNGDGVFGDASGPSPVLTWSQLESFGIDDGQSTPTTYPIKLEVISGTVTATANASIVVSNTAPIAVITGSLKATVGQPFTVKVGADDPSSADMAAQFSYTIDWGDGSPVETVPGPADPLVTHTYTGQGNFDAAFTATDKDGGQGDRTAVVVLAEPATTPTPTPSSSSSSPTSSPTRSTTATTGPTSTSTSTGGSGNLANTGASIGPGAIVAGAALLIGGTALLVLARRRTVHGSHE